VTTLPLLSSLPPPHPCPFLSCLFSLAGYSGRPGGIIVENLGEIYEIPHGGKKECSSSLDKLNEIVPTCFIAGAHGPADSTTRNYRDVGPGRAGVDGRRRYNLKLDAAAGRSALLPEILIPAPLFHPRRIINVICRKP